MSYHNQYLDIINACCSQPLTSNNRTATKIGVAPGTQLLRHWGPSIPVIGGRRVYLKSAAAEVAWYLSGTRSCEWLNRHTSMWRPWQDHESQVEAAYGYRWRSANGVDQIALAIDTLRTDPTSRRVWIDTWNPQADSNPAATNTPCPLGFYLQINNNQLNMSVVMRSSDVAVGLIYDTLSFKMLHNAISAELSILTGEFEMILLNAHIYEPQIPVIKQIAQAGFGYRQIGQELLPIHLPDCAWSISNIVADPDGFVEYVNQYDYLVKDLPKFDMFVAV